MNKSIGKGDFLEKNFFTVSQVCKVCGISRSTILRLESKGLLTPAQCDEQTGYRYYDNHNINKVLQIKAFQEMGLQYDDIKDFYDSEGNSAVFIKKLAHIAAASKRTLEEMQLRSDNKNHLSCELIDLPDYICYARSFSGKNIADKYNDMYDLCHEAFTKGYRMIATEPLFILNQYDEFFGKVPEGGDIHYTCCMPVEPGCASDETTLILGGKALSVLHYGNNIYDKKKIQSLIAEKLNELNLKRTEVVRGLCIVAPYMGREINPDKFVSRIIVPVEE